MLCKGTETMSFRLSYHRVNNPEGYFSSLFNFYGIGKKRLIFYLEFEGLFTQTYGKPPWMFTEPLPIHKVWPSFVLY